MSFSNNSNIIKVDTSKQNDSNTVLAVYNCRKIEANEDLIGVTAFVNNDRIIEYYQRS